MVKVIWTDSAIEDLDDIGEYIAKDSIRYAEITVLELFESVDILESHPNAGFIVPEFENEFIRQIIRGNYRIVYQIIDEFRIDILTVHNCARLISNTNPFKDTTGHNKYSSEPSALTNSKSVLYSTRRTKDQVLIERL